MSIIMVVGLNTLQCRGGLASPPNGLLGLGRMCILLTLFGAVVCSANRRVILMIFLLDNSQTNLLKLKQDGKKWPRVFRRRSNSWWLAKLWRDKKLGLGPSDGIGLACA